MNERDDTHARLEALLEEQAALRRVATRVAGDPDPASLFSCVCEEIGRVLGVENTYVLRFDEGARATAVGGWSVHGAEMDPSLETVPLDGDTALVRVSRSGRPQRADDLSEVGGELAARLRGAGIRSSVAAPVTLAGRLWGAVVATAPRPHAFPRDAEGRMAAFAELVTDALANADARNQLAASRARIVEAGDAERRRLGRDLHDGAQREIVGAVISLQLAQQRWTQDPARARELVDAALEQAQAAIRDLRELVAGIHPSVLTHRGLVAALQALATRSPLPVELEADVAGRLPAPVETTAYFVAAEALTNVAKHAHGTHAAVRVRVEDGRASVAVSDDGVGGADVTAGSGLRGLADRVSALEGTLEIESPPGAGTTVRARIPLRS